MATSNTFSQPWQNLLGTAIDNQISTLAVEKTGDTMSGTLYLYNSAASQAAYATQSVTSGTTTNLLYQPSLVLGSNNVPTYTTTTSNAGVVTTTTNNYALALNGDTAVKAGCDLFYNGVAVGLPNITGSSYYQSAATACNLATPASAIFSCQTVGHLHSIAITWTSDNLTAGVPAGSIVNPSGGVDANWAALPSTVGSGTSSYIYTLFPAGTISAPYRPVSNARFASVFFNYTTGGAVTATDADQLNNPCIYTIGNDGGIYLRLYPLAGDLTTQNTTFGLALPHVCVTWVDVQ